ncbi:MAG: IS21-like element helper ATPase IstB [Pseudomonadales bacterium]
MNDVALNDPLQTLRLSQMKAHWRDLEQHAIAIGWTPANFLSQLCEQELEHRLQQRHKRYLKEAKLPAGKTLNTLQLECLKGINPAVIQHLGDQHDWIEQGDNLLLFGASGLGKTPIAAAIGSELVSHGIRGRFYGATELVQRLQEAKQALKLNELLLKLDRYRFIIIDDIGYVSRDLQETSVLFELIAHRYERASLIITANQPFSQWNSIFADTSMTVAAVDRLIHHAHIIELEGEESYRRKTAKKISKTAQKA